MVAITAGCLRRLPSARKCGAKGHWSVDAPSLCGCHEKYRLQQTDGKLTVAGMPETDRALKPYQAYPRLPCGAVATFTRVFNFRQLKPQLGWASKDMTYIPLALAAALRVMVAVGLVRRFSKERRTLAIN